MGKQANGLYISAASSLSSVIGVDEVGRGCWAGPLYAAAVILDKPIDGLRDSKKTTRLQRNKLSYIITHQALAYGIGRASVLEIDKHGLTHAVRLAMQRAVKKIKAPYEIIIIDGNFNFLNDMITSQTLVKADTTIPAVSAASIIAKVARDEYMGRQDAHYPGYGFSDHVGYGTAFHRQALQLYGLTPLHRRTVKPIRMLSESLASDATTYNELPKMSIHI